jgi:glycosyltransferase involved in cell wall biosynthesis
MNILANSLSKKGWNVTLVPINASTPDGVNVICPVKNFERAWDSGLFELIPVVIKFVRFVREESPNLIILNCDLPEFLGLFLPRKQRVVVVEHSPKPFQSRFLIGRLVRFSERVRKAAFVRVSPNLSIWSNDNIESTYIPNAVELKTLHDMNLYKDAAYYPISRLVYLGRLAPEKNPILFFEIGQALNLPALVIGGGPMLRDLKMRFTDQVDFIGHSLEPWSFIKRGDLLVVTSDYEGDGLVVTEAIIKGVPLIIRDNDDLRRFGLDEKNYALNLESFVEKISSSTDISNFVVQDQIRVDTSRQRSVESIAEKWEDLLNGLLQAH